MNSEDSFDLAPCGLALLGPDGVFLRVNRALLDWTGYSAPELVGKKKLADLLDGDGNRFFADLAYALTQEKSSVDEIFLLLLCKSGGLLPTYFNFTGGDSGSEDGVAANIRVAAFRGENRACYEAELLLGKQAAKQL